MIIAAFLITQYYTEGELSMDKIIKVKVGNRTYDYPQGITLENISKDFQKHSESLIVAAKVNNNLRELHNPVFKDSSIEFVDISSGIGQRIYHRSISFVFIRAAMELLEGCEVSVEHSLSKGLYCEITYDTPIDKDIVAAIEDRMRSIIEKNEEFIKKKIPTEEAKEIFKKYGMVEKERLLNYRKNNTINIYSLGWLRNYFYGYMVPNTSYIKDFKLKFYAPGVIIQFPSAQNPHYIPEFKKQDKLSAILNEAKEWGNILDVAYVANLNDLIVKDEYQELIRIAEALHEKKVAEIADMITTENKRLVTIAGPSSSGKTTFAQRLMIQLKVNGLNPISISIDDYFVNRDRTPLDDEGKYDFEALEAVDVELFNKDLSDLIAGKEIELPTFNFVKGEREYRGNKLQIDGDQPIIIEGIHGLNEKLTKAISTDKKFKIYISALTQLNIDKHNRIPTTDTRLLRRIVRDSKYRGHSAKTTLDLWKSVRRGEERNIFPYQESADIMFNSALVYELAVLKKYAQPLLLEIGEDEPEYVEAKRLLKFLNYFKTIRDDNYVLQTSILKEFIGGSCFVEE